MSYKQFIFKQIYFIILCGVIGIIQFSSCKSKEEKNKHSTYEEMIIGNWKDSNSIVAYLNNNTFDGWFGEDKKRLQGYYKIVDDTLKMNFPAIEHYPEYIIKKMDTQFFEIRSLDDDEIFVKRRIKFIE